MEVEDEENPFCMQENFQDQPDQTQDQQEESIETQDQEEESLETQDQEEESLETQDQEEKSLETQYQEDVEDIDKSLENLVAGKCQIIIIFFKSVYSNCTDVCEHCQETATLFCKECSNTYCMMCSALRHKQPSRASHHITRLIELEQADNLQQHDHPSGM